MFFTSIWIMLKKNLVLKSQENQHVLWKKKKYSANIVEQESVFEARPHLKVFKISIDSTKPVGLQ